MMQNPTDTTNAAERYAARFNVSVEVFHAHLEGQYIGLSRLIAELHELPDADRNVAFALISPRATRTMSELDAYDPDVVAQ